MHKEVVTREIGKVTFTHFMFFLGNSPITYSNQEESVSLSSTVKKSMPFEDEYMPKIPTISTSRL